MHYLIITAITVSIDSFVCGLSLCLDRNKKISLISGITLTVFLMCLIAKYISLFFKDYITEKTACLGGLLLIGIGIYDLISSNIHKSPVYHNELVLSIIMGISLGIDGAFATISLSLMGISGFYVPLTIALTHLIMISLGVILRKICPVKIFAKIGFIPPVILILLGGFKLLGLFI